VALLPFFPALWLSRLLHLTNEQKGVFLPAAVFANVGFYGGYIAFERFGQLGYNLVALYMIYFSPLYYTFGFMVCEHYAQISPDPNWAKRLGLLFKRDIVYRPLVGILIGFCLNQWGPERPAAIGRFVNILIPMMMWGFLCLAGFSIRFQRMGRHLKNAFWFTGLKFTVPLLVTFACIGIFGLAGPGSAMIRKVLILEAICPIGVSVIILPSLFNVDGDLANTIWVVTHLVGFFLVLPFFYLLV
jgi:predicted permease